MSPDTVFPTGPFPSCPPCSPSDSRIRAWEVVRRVSQDTSRLSATFPHRLPGCPPEPQPSLAFSATRPGDWMTAPRPAAPGAVSASSSFTPKLCSSSVVRICVFPRSRCGPPLTPPSPTLVRGRGRQPSFLPAWPRVSPFLPLVFGRLSSEPSPAAVRDVLCVPGPYGDTVHVPWWDPLARGKPLRLPAFCADGGFLPTVCSGVRPGVR